MTTAFSADPDYMAAFEHAAKIFDEQHDDFEWLPHFKVPPPPWLIYMLFGGRGSGKTAHAAKYVHDHVHGPPCLPNVPGGHWISIVGPTLGDAVTSCIEGPSGLRAHDPGIKTINRPGGIIARWSNGAEAKLFGAHSPEDIERFRAGGNRCLTGDTPISILRNGVPMDVPIATATTSDLALTRQGYMPIDRAGLVAVDQPIWEVELSDGTVVHCTADHRWYVQSGTKDTMNLCLGDTIPTWSHLQEHRMSQFRSEIQSYTEESYSLGNLEGITDKDHEAGTFISMFGNARLAQSRMVLRSTTRTKTKRTTVKRTFNASRTTSTCDCTRAGSEGNVSQRRANTAAKTSSFLPQRLSGPTTPATARRSAGIETTLAETRGSAGHQTGTHALDAGRTLGTRITVRKNATIKHARPTTAPARSAASRCPDNASVSVVRVAMTPRREAVYCVRVPGPHEITIHHHVVSANCLVWAEEFAAWRYMEECYNQIRYGLRVGPRPHMIVSTTPRVRKLLKQLIKDPKVVVRVGTMYQNPHLPQDIKDQLEKDYGGTRMGRQELMGELLEDIENALWSGLLIDELRPKPWQVPEDYDRIVVAVDPSMGDGTDSSSDETGIVVGGVVYKYEGLDIAMAGMSHGFVLEDCSLHGGVNAWAKRAVRAYHEHQADMIVAEVNNGGDLVIQAIKGIDPTVPVEKVWASRGKTKRAEPISNLYDQRRMHHVGLFAELEDQMTGWDAKDPDPAWSPDRMDALVWCFTELMLETNQIKQSKPRDDRLKNRR